MQQGHGTLQTPGLLDKLAGLRGLGGSPGNLGNPNANAMASPASQPQGGGGMRNIQLPSMNIPAQLGALTAQGPAPLGPGAMNPILLNLLKLHLGISG